MQVPIQGDQAGIRRIEGGGPPRRADLSSMPRPVRWFGYGFITSVVLMTAACFVLTLLD
ncbi:MULTISPECIES: hypothetical protein [Paenibacillus]|uniref:hypothetical protein n=1 Tax=Paenibacillus TaxID=44249 RepID=UPI0022B90A9D|nr:hypothetical protein [Paenibacillus caseinilyticus]MCZ8522899.1 hypothetical protein [Paenibacillus caseinilyticus]